MYSRILGFAGRVSTLIDGALDIAQHLQSPNQEALIAEPEPEVPVFTIPSRWKAHPRFSDDALVPFGDDIRAKKEIWEGARDELRVYGYSQVSSQRVGNLEFFERVTSLGSLSYLLQTFEAYLVESFARFQYELENDELDIWEIKDVENDFIQMLQMDFQPVIAGLVRESSGDFRRIMTETDIQLAGMILQHVGDLEGLFQSDKVHEIVQETLFNPLIELFGGMSGES